MIDVELRARFEWLEQLVAMNRRKRRQEFCGEKCRMCRGDVRGGYECRVAEFRRTDGRTIASMV